MLKKSFRRDIIQLTALYLSFRSAESFYSDSNALTVYDRYFSKLQEMCSTYGKTARQIAGAMNI